MISQRACYTIHGDDHRPLGGIINELGEDGLLSSIVARAKYPNKIETALKRMDMTRSVVFPDFDGIAGDIVSRSLTRMVR